MTNSNAFDADRGRNAEQRHRFVKQWAEYVRTHDDEDWSVQQNTLIDSQLQSANRLAASGETDPVGFFEARDRLRTDQP